MGNGIKFIGAALLVISIALGALGNVNDENIMFIIYGASAGLAMFLIGAVIQKIEFIQTDIELLKLDRLKSLELGNDNLAEQYRDRYVSLLASENSRYTSTTKQAS